MPVHSWSRVVNVEPAYLVLIQLVKYYNHTHTKPERPRPVTNFKGKGAGLWSGI